MIYLETNNQELFEELASFGWKHPLSKYVKPGEPMEHSYETDFKDTKIRITHLHPDSPRPPESSEFVSWLVQNIEQDPYRKGRAR